MKADATTPAASLSAVPAPELARLAQGLALTFWGMLAMLGAMIELVLAPIPRLFPLLISAAGAAGMAGGAWWLRATPSVGAAWQRRVHGLIVTGVLTAYLTPFCWMWRQVPVSRYLLVHALVWSGAFIVHLALANECVRLIGRAAGQRSLVFQAAVFGAATVLVLFLPFLWLAAALARLAWAGHDPLELMQFALGHLPASGVFVLLAPVALTLSLVWEAKDMALERLTATPANPMLPTSRS